MSLLPHDQSAIWLYEDTSCEFHSEANAVQALVSLAARAEASVVQAEVDSKLADLKSDSPSEERAKIVTSACVYEGRESVSHLMGISGRYLTVLRSALQGHDEQRAAAECVARTWERCRQNVVLVMDKFVSMKLISPFSVVSFHLAQPLTSRGPCCFCLRRSTHRVDGFGGLSTQCTWSRLQACSACCHAAHTHAVVASKL